MPYINERKWAGILQDLNDLDSREAELTRLRADLAAAQEREQRMREALEHYAEPCDAMPNGPCPYDGNMCCKVARAALSAMSGEP